jgi:hypothetical protein
MPYPVFIGIISICAVVSVFSYIGFVYWKIRNWDKNPIVVIATITKFFFLALLVFFIVSFPIAIISASN